MGDSTDSSLRQLALITCLFFDPLTLRDYVAISGSTQGSPRKPYLASNVAIRGINYSALNDEGRPAFYAGNRLTSARTHIARGKGPGYTPKPLGERGSAA
jgi:hypothetical protein